MNKLKMIGRIKLLTIAFVSIGLVVGSGAAYAFWTSSGSGANATPATAANPSALGVSVAVDNGIFPGGSVAVSGTITNNSGQPQDVHAIAADTSQFTNGVETTDNAGCPGDWFGFTGTVTPTTLASGASVSYTGTLSMTNEPVNQDACKGAGIVLHVTAS